MKNYLKLVTRRRIFSENSKKHKEINSLKFSPSLEDTTSRKVFMPIHSLQLRYTIMRCR